MSNADLTARSQPPMDRSGFDEKPCLHIGQGDFAAVLLSCGTMALHDAASRGRTK